MYFVLMITFASMRKCIFLCFTISFKNEKTHLTTQNPSTSHKSYVSKINLFHPVGSLLYFQHCQDKGILLEKNMSHNNDKKCVGGQLFPRSARVLSWQEIFFVCQQTRRIWDISWYMYQPGSINDPKGVTSIHMTIFRGGTLRSYITFICVYRFSEQTVQYWCCFFPPKRQHSIQAHTEM